LPAGVTRQCDRTPKAKHFYKKANSLQQVTAQWRSKHYSVRRKLNFLKGNEEMLTYLQHNSRTDSIEGFVDYGGSNNRLAFADHALTFMLKRIHKKWKQTVSFTFCL
jgi:hypothetical protein